MSFCVFLSFFLFYFLHFPSLSFVSFSLFYTLPSSLSLSFPLYYSLILSLNLLCFFVSFFLLIFILHFRSHTLFLSISFRLNKKERNWEPSYLSKLRKGHWHNTTSGAVTVSCLLHRAWVRLHLITFQWRVTLFLLLFLKTLFSFFLKSFILFKKKRCRFTYSKITSFCHAVTQSKLCRSVIFRKKCY